MIKILEHWHNAVAKQIYTVFQNSYKIEAKLIGTQNFPPLFRRVQDIEHANSQFYGYFEDNSLAAVVEIVINGNQLEIDSFTVDPKYFRKGIANKLLHFVLSEIDYSKAVVETAVVNMPAINLYKKHGFVEVAMDESSVYKRTDIKMEILL